MLYEEKIVKSSGDDSGVKAVIGLVVVIIALLTFSSFFTIVPTGHRGVVIDVNRVTGEVLGEGLYWKKPFVESIVDMDVQRQNYEVEAAAASKDLQDVTVKVSTIYKLDPSTVSTVYQEMNKDYLLRLLAPSVQESIKSATAKYTAEELVTKRAEVRESIALNIKEKVEYRGILVDDVNIINLSFSESFNQAIENKVRAEQDALASRNTLEKIKYEAQQAVEKAKGEADSRIATAEAEARAIKIQAEAIQNQGGAEYVNLKAIEKWDGTLPTQMIPGSTVPFINLTK